MENLIFSRPKTPSICQKKHRVASAMIWNPGDSWWLGVSSIQIVHYWYRMWEVKTAKTLVLWWAKESHNMVFPMYFVGLDPYISYPSQHFHMIFILQSHPVVPRRDACNQFTGQDSWSACASAWTSWRETWRLCCSRMKTVIRHQLAPFDHLIFKELMVL